jgi:nitroreductase
MAERMMLYIGYPADDFAPNTKMSGHRKPLEETCFWNEAPKYNRNQQQC